MTEDDVRNVQASFAQLQSRANQFGATFYERLFITHPQVRSLFPEDIAPQSKKLVQMLSLVANSLHEFDAVLPAVQVLARRHVGYGVKEEHYAIVGDTLLWTLAHCLGPAFTEEVKCAWSVAYAALSNAMIAASADAVSQ
ncbi:globin family protein [Pelagibacterium halotolerans]|uniref:globin family protein n=1 Tax=Pelagibacterium halotolerans TaxID=531813 RepID=UPI00384D3881